jgi:hypothetical protein
MSSFEQDGVIASSPPPPMVASAPGAESDRAFVEHLRTAGRLGELDEESMDSLLAALDARESIAARRIDFLEAYYLAAGDLALGDVRSRVDRFFLHRDVPTEPASFVVERLADLAPEVGDPRLERIGGLDGQLVLRSDDDLSPVEDDDADAREDSTVTVRGLVRAVNGLLERRGVPERFISVLADGEREVYLAFDVSSAMRLLGAGLLPEATPEELMELGAW